MPATILRFASLALSFAGRCPRATRTPVPDKRATILRPALQQHPSGAELFTKHCAVCHGADLKGTGPFPAPYRTPPDLTTLARRHEGKFPAAYVSKVLRAGVTLPAHGPAEMPVWGAEFQAKDKAGRHKFPCASKLSSTTLSRCRLSNAIQPKTQKNYPHCTSIVRASQPLSPREGRGQPGTLQRLLSTPVDIRSHN